MVYEGLRGKGNETFLLHSGESLRLSCCDCALTHDVFVFGEKSKPIWLTIIGNSRATGQLRRYRKKK